MKLYCTYTRVLARDRPESRVEAVDGEVLTSCLLASRTPGKTSNFLPCSSSPGSRCPSIWLVTILLLATWPWCTLTARPRRRFRLLSPRLGYNNISPDGANALATLLGDGPGTLEILELGYNRIGDDGAVALAKGLEIAGARDRSTANGKGLLRLGLAGNGIGWAGGGALAKSLSGRRGRAPELQELELAGNMVSVGPCRLATLPE